MCGMVYSGEFISWFVLKDTLPFGCICNGLHYRLQEDLHHMVCSCQFAQSLWYWWMRWFGLCGGLVYRLLLNGRGGAFDFSSRKGKSVLEAGCLIGLTITKFL